MTVELHSAATLTRAPVAPQMPLAHLRRWSQLLVAVAVAAMIAIVPLTAAYAQPNDAYRPPSEESYAPPPAADDYASPNQGETYEPYPPPGQSGGSSGYGEPYSPPESAARGERYERGPVYDDEPGPRDRGTYSQNEIIRAGHGFFGSISSGLASAIEWAFKNAGRPNGYILGQDAGGALVAGLRYGEGRLHTKDAGVHRVYWQGPTIGYDAGAEGSKVMTLVYNLHDPSDIYQRFGGVQGAAYLVGGVGVQLQKAGHVTLAPIRAGVGVRLGANVGYLKYTREPTWNPF